MIREASAQGLAGGLTPAMTKRCGAAPAKGKIWIDLDNSPHVPLFAPIVEELEERGYPIVLTVRDCFQVQELADFFHLKYRLVGRHSGKNTIRKMAGLFFRAMQLLPTILREKPRLAVGVCSRSQLIVSTVLGIPSLFMGDYEHSKGWAFIRPTWLLCLEVIPDSAMRMDPRRVMKYPGTKEDVYVPRYVPDPSIRSQLGLPEHEVVATIRPPATEAHYHNPQSDQLFAATVEYLSRFHNVKLIALPRDVKQADELRKRWPALLADGRMCIPRRVVNGLNLIWHSDFVISAGGTMNREAAALGVPVYSVFRGKIGAVDHYLASQGRLVLLESVEDVQTKIVIAQRHRPRRPENHPNNILPRIVDQIIAFMDAEHSSSTTPEGIGLTPLASIAGKGTAEFTRSELTK